MQRLFRSLIGALFLLPSVAISQAQQPANTMDAYAVYSEMCGNAPVGCFWMSGGHGGLSVPVWRNFSAVVEAGGHTTDHIPNFNAGLSLLYGMGGVRMRVPNHTHFQPFGQALFGGVHGFDGYFPAPVGKLSTSYDSSFALTIRGGLDIRGSRHIWIRALQADCFYSELRNLQGALAENFTELTFSLKHRRRDKISTDSVARQAQTTKLNIRHLSMNVCSVLSGGSCELCL